MSSLCRNVFEYKVRDDSNGKPPVLPRRTAGITKDFFDAFDATYLSCPRYAVTTPAVLPVVANTLTSEKRVGFCRGIREPVSLPRVRYVDCGAFPTLYITLYDIIFQYIEKVFYISSYIGIYNQICGSPVL
jgi:hypothetical protein